VSVPKVTSPPEKTQAAPRTGVASIIKGIGASLFFPANSSAVMKAAAQEAFGIA
jgi:hypothetical protein